MGTGKKKLVITGQDICLAVGIIMTISGVYWMWIRSESDTTTACCCFCTAAILLFNRARKIRSTKS